MNRLIFILAIAALGFSSCSLDSFLYNEKKIDRYNLSTAIIPATQRTEYTFLSDGHRLYAYDVQPPDSHRTGMTVLYCHGNKDNIEEYWDRAERFYEMGIRCFIFDYQGFGRSEGSPSVSALASDGRAALRFVLDSLHVGASDLFFYGYSLGNVVSIDLAANVMNPLKLIAEAPFASTDAMLHSSTLLDLPGSFVIDTRIDNAAQIARIHTPFLLLHGAQDEFVSWNDNGRVVYDHAPTPKELELVAGADHTNIPEVMGHANYNARILRFLTERF